MHTRVSLQKALALAETTVDIDGEPVRIREVSLPDRLAADARARREDGTIDQAVMWASMIAGGVIGEDGQPLYSVEDIPQIARWRHIQIARLGLHILALSEARPGDMKSVDTSADAG